MKHHVAVGALIIAAPSICHSGSCRLPAARAGVIYLLWCRDRQAHRPPQPVVADVPRMDSWPFAPQTPGRHKQSLKCDASTHTIFSPSLVFLFSSKLPSVLVLKKPGLHPATLRRQSTSTLATCWLAPSRSRKRLICH